MVSGTRYSPFAHELLSGQNYAMNTVEFFYDFSSPWTYLAQTQIEALCQRNNARLRYRPLFLGGLFKTTGHTPTMSNPLKWKYSLADMEDWASHYGVPLKMPSRFPINTLGALRASAAIEKAGHDPARFIGAVFRAYWAEDADISNPDVLASLLEKSGEDTEAILAATQTEEIKSAVKESTDEAHRRGVFGAPSFFVGDKMFWGNDRLQFLENWLKRHPA